MELLVLLLVLVGVWTLIGPAWAMGGTRPLRRELRALRAEIAVLRNSSQQATGRREAAEPAPLSTTAEMRGPTTAPIARELALPYRGLAAAAAGTGALMSALDWLALELRRSLDGTLPTGKTGSAESSAYPALLLLSSPPLLAVGIGLTHQRFACRHRCEAAS